MDFYYYNNDRQKVKQTLEVNDKWSEKMTSSSDLNTIFQKIDNGDDIISELELDTLRRILKASDTNNDNISNDWETAYVRWTYSADDYKNTQKAVMVGTNIYNDIFAKNCIGFPTTGKNIAKHVEAVNVDNVINVIGTYSDKTEGKESIFSGILSEVGLPLKERFKYVKHIFSQLVEYYNQKGIKTDDIVKEFNTELNYQKSTWSVAESEKIDALVEKLKSRYEGKSRNQSSNVMPNGKIDGDFKQGRTGDCWLLASIKAISKTPKGLKILNDSISVAPNGDVTVTLKGVNKKYTFSRKDILGNTQLSTGDLDVRAIEMAVDKYFAEVRGVRGKIDINENHAHVAYNILTGKGGRNVFSNSYGRIPECWFTDSQIDNFNKPNHIACVMARNKQSISLKATNGEKAKLVTSHIYTVSRSDSKYVYLINPWDTSFEIPVPRETFKDFFNCVDEFDL